MEPIIEFKDFSFKYRAQMEPTLKDISLRIYPGEKILVAGPSGSGKSTLAHCINGLVPFSYHGDFTGTCKIKGQNSDELGIFGLSKIVGTVLQDTDGQFVGLTVAEDIAFALENDCIPRQEMYRKVEETAELVDISGHMEHAPGELSGGQKQRVSMAGVIVNDVEVLLFDEPLANLDPASGKRTIDLIDRICREQGVTVIIIEHRLEDVLYRDVDRIVVMGEGRIVCDAAPDELLSTRVLEEQGIREPLYVTALKHAGCRIEAALRPQHIETMNLESCREAVRAWFESAPPKKAPHTGEDILTVSKLGFSYNGTEKVLNNIDFTVKKGEMLALVGKNGAGKSTLSALVCGFIAPDTGVIFLDGNDISPLSVSERGGKIGLVMQNPNQMISKPMIYDEVALGLRMRNVPEEEVTRRVHDILSVCGLYRFRKWPVSALSFGQKKRVTIASILVMNPEILILDEPTAGQDYRRYTEIMEFIRDINRTLGITIIMITHDMHLMLEYTDRAVVMADGEIIYDGTPAGALTDGDVSERACLKKTSLYDLAVGCGIDNPTEFVERFISCESKLRSGQHNTGEMTGQKGGFL